MPIRSGDTGSAPALAQLEPVLNAGGQRLVELLVRTEGRLAELANGYGSDLSRHAEDTLTAGGKRLRPITVFLCAGDESHDDVVRAAVAVELVHMATLVHDDVLDRATLRRGRATVFRSGGRPAATATGDFLFSRAFEELVATRNPEVVRALSDASSALARGELMQRADAWSDDVSAERYLERCELKTARLFEASCRLGAMLGSSREAELVERLGTFGSRIGVAFQIFDDVLDVSGPPERTGKHRGADLLDGTVTLPLILARRRDPYLRRLDLRAEVTDAARAEEVCDRIAATGALADAREAALGYVAEAKRALEGLELTPSQRTALELVADGVVERYS
ncbi:MAG: polyprenyl synthetase family protein [Thermoleophilaceae bacterium]|nr:polyprenyl synthetase family protein [Thermoleophilaceae bacterium]